MRTLLLSASYHPVLGGLQTVVHTLAYYFSANGHQVRVVTNRYPRSLSVFEMIAGIPIYRWIFLQPTSQQLINQRPDLFLASLYYYPVTLLHLFRLFWMFRPNIVNVHFPDGQISHILLLRRWFYFRLVVSLHGEDILVWNRLREKETEELVNTRQQPKRLTRLRQLFKQADAITACSQYLLDKAVELEPDVATKGYVIHNGIDPVRFQDQTPYIHVRPYILAYGRLTHKKGFDLLLNAFNQISFSQYELDLILAGVGEERSRLEKQVQEYGLTGRVHFYGQAQPDEIVRLLNGCCFLVVPSRDEPFGIVALEGLAAGKPILATAVGGLPEILKASENILVEPTVVGLVDGLRRLFEQEQRWVTVAQSNRTLAKKFTWERATAQYLKTYQV